MSDRTGLPDSIVLDGELLTSKDVAAVSRHDTPVELTAESRERIRESCEHVESVLDSSEPVCGVNAGFGHLVETHIDREDIECLQTNLTRGHVAGVGHELTREEVRSVMVSQANTLVKGFSGIRSSVVSLLVPILNEGVQPTVRSHGSLGASGDLTPLVRMALTLIGESEARIDDRRLPGDEALRAAGLELVALAFREGLTLVNGTQLTIGLAALFVVDAERTIEAASTAGVLATEIAMRTTTNCDPAIHEVRPHPGQQENAATIRRPTAGSTVLESYKNYERVQGIYSIRCLPQVRGTARDAVSHLHEAIEVELNSATDNPFVFPAGAVGKYTPDTSVAAVVPADNFHGKPLALHFDHAADALTKLATVSRYRTDQMLNPDVWEPYPSSFLTERNGLRSGYMIAQYTAVALLNRCRSLGRPSTDSTSISNGWGNHVGVGSQSTLNTYTAAGNVTTIVGIELLCESRTAEFLDEGLELEIGTGVVHSTIRSVVPSLDKDHRLNDELETAAGPVRFGAIHAVIVDAELSG